MPGGGKRPFSLQHVPSRLLASRRVTPTAPASSRSQLTRRSRRCAPPLGGTSSRGPGSSSRRRARTRPGSAEAARQRFVGTRHRWTAGSADIDAGALAQHAFTRSTAARRWLTWLCGTASGKHLERFGQVNPLFALAGDIPRFESADLGLLRPGSVPANCWRATVKPTGDPAATGANEPMMRVRDGRGQTGPASRDGGIDDHFALPKRRRAVL